MATKKPVEEIEELEDEELDTPTPKLKMDGITVAVPKKVEEDKGPTVQIILPRLEDSGSAGLEVDQYEHVTIANELGEQHYKILRGTHVDVPVPVFIQLKNRYPDI